MKKTPYQQKIDVSLDESWKQFHKLLEDQNHTDLEAMYISGKLFQHVLLISLNDEKDQIEAFHDIYGDLLEQMRFFVQQTFNYMMERETERESEDHDRQRN